MKRMLLQTVVLVLCGFAQSLSGVGRGAAPLGIPDRADA